MRKTLLAWFGLLALLTLAGGTAAGLAVLHDRVRVVVSPDLAQDPALQATAQLRDEIGQIQRDVRALAAALTAGIQHVTDTMEEGATTRAEAIARDLAQAHGAQAALAREVAALASGQRAIRDAIAESATRLTATPPVAPPVTAPQGVADPAIDIIVTPPSQPVAATPVAPPRRRSAFAFTLPSESFRFAGRQRLEILPSLSRVGFDAKSTLHDFTGVTSSLTGTVTLDLADPEAACTGAIRVQADALDTGLAGRNEAMRQHLATTDHREIAFVVEAMGDAKVDADARTTQGTVRGKLTIRGQTRAVAMPVRLRVDESQRVHAEGEATISLPDYGVPVPSQLGVISMQPEVKIWIALQARSLGEATEAGR